MKTLSRCTFVLAFALIVLLAVPAVQAAEPAVEAPAAKAALVDAPVVDTMCPDDQPVFASLDMADDAAFCIDSGIECDSPRDCVGECFPYTCVCQFNGVTDTCQYCP